MDFVNPATCNGHNRIKIDELLSSLSDEGVFHPCLIDYCKRVCSDIKLNDYSWHDHCSVRAISNRYIFTQV